MTTRSRRRSALAAILGALACGLVPAAAQAQAGVVRLILPHSPGSGVDVITRTLQPPLAKALGASVVVENQAGAGGVIGLQALARAAPDGNTLTITSNNLVILPSVLKSVPFDVSGDFTPIAILGNTPIIMVANPAKVPAANARELVALLKSRPGQLNYASSGNGTILHLAGEMFLQEAQVSARHIPYKGVAPMLTDVIGGQVEFTTAALPSVQPHIRSGALRAIGNLSAQRSPAAPEIPTFVEQGLPGYVVEAWFALIGPKGMSAASVKRTHDAIVAAFADPAVTEAMTKQGNVISISTPEQALATVRSELIKYSTLVRKAGIEPQ